LVEQDLARHVDRIAAERPVTAIRFIDAVEGAFRRLQQLPEIGVLREFEDERLNGLRMWPVPRNAWRGSQDRPRTHGTPLLRDDAAPFALVTAPPARGRAAVECTANKHHN
jgi:hypothetical protein